MSDALITGIIAVVVCLINNYFQAKQTAKANDKNIALIEYKITELSDRVNRHNEVITRTFRLEESTALQEAELKRQNERLKILEAKA